MSASADHTVRYFVVDKLQNLPLNVTTENSTELTLFIMPQLFGIQQATISSVDTTELGFM
jgi:hypothetical protein